MLHVWRTTCVAHFVNSFKLQNACLATNSGITTYVPTWPFVPCYINQAAPPVWSISVNCRFFVGLPMQSKGIVNQQDSGDFFGCCTTCLASGIMLPALFGGVNLMLVPLGTAMVSCPCLNHRNMDMCFESSKTSGLHQLQQAALLASALPGLVIV